MIDLGNPAGFAGAATEPILIGLAIAAIAVLVIINR